MFELVLGLVTGGGQHAIEGVGMGQTTETGEGGPDGSRRQVGDWQGCLLAAPMTSEDAGKLTARGGFIDEFPQIIG